jgi:cysteine desulfurase
MIYLDNAAATPLDPAVFAAMQPYFTEQFYNPSATYLPAKAVHGALEAARGRVAHWLGARPTEVIFTAGGTEANNLAIQGVLRKFPNCSVLVSSIEHDSVLKTAEQFNCYATLVTEQGRVALEDLRAKITDETVLVSVMYANNEVGTIQPIRDIADIVREIRENRRQKGNKTPLYLHTDACQAANYLDLQAARLGVDMMTLNGGKIYGPKQSGVLYVESHVELEPLIYGGGQERGVRSGTENVAGAIGFAAALDAAQSMRKTEAHRLAELQQYAYRQIFEKLRSATVNGDTKHRLPNNLHLTLPGTDNERVLLQLEAAGILAAAGSACSASDEEPSHVLRAMGLSDADARSSLRITTGRTTTQQDIDTLIDTLVTITK